MMDLFFSTPKTSSIHNVASALFLCQASLMLFTADETADRYLCCGLVPNSKAAKKDTNKWVQVR